MINKTGIILRQEQKHSIRCCFVVCSTGGSPYSICIVPETEEVRDAPTAKYKEEDTDMAAVLLSAVQAFN
jgi:chemotaxis methyl-accepting protein methylase